MTRTPCVRRGNPLHTGEECVDLAWDAFNGDRHSPVIARLLCAAGLLDEALEKRTRGELAAARGG